MESCRENLWNEIQLKAQRHPKGKSRQRTSVPSTVKKAVVVGTKICLHTKFNDFIFTGRVLGYLRVNLIRSEEKIVS